MNCWSWRRGGGCRAEARTGAHTCEAHQNEEDGIVLVLDRLASLQNDLRGLAGTQHRHPDMYKDLAEDPARTFFRKAIREAAVAVGYSNDDRSQRDMVIADPSAGSLLNGGKVLLSDDGAEKYGHLEIKYSASGDLSDLKGALTEDLDRVHGTLATAAQEGWSYKPWTGCILLGPAWSSHFPKLLVHLHEYYHQRDLTRVQAQKGAWWPVVDSITFPGMWLKLHEVRAGKTEDSPRTPVFHMFRAADGDPQRELRPLAIAAAFARHSVRYWKDLACKGEALQRMEYSAACGPGGDHPRNGRTNIPIPYLCIDHPAEEMLDVFGKVTIQLTLDDALSCEQQKRIVYGVRPEEEVRLERVMADKELEDITQRRG